MTGFRFSRSNVQYPARKLGQFSSAVQYIYYTAVAVLFSMQDTVQLLIFRRINTTQPKTTTLTFKMMLFEIKFQ